MIEHGLNARRAYKAADLRVVLDNGDVILRVRDGGPAFNLKDYARRLENPALLPDGIGLRILLGKAKDVSYYRSYGMNTTIMRI